MLSNVVLLKPTVLSNLSVIIYIFLTMYFLSALGDNKLEVQLQKLARVCRLRAPIKTRISITKGVASLWRENCSDAVVT